MAGCWAGSSRRRAKGCERWPAAWDRAAFRIWAGARRHEAAPRPKPEVHCGSGQSLPARSDGPESGIVGFHTKSDERRQPGHGASQAWAYPLSRLGQTQELKKAPRSIGPLPCRLRVLWFPPTTLMPRGVAHPGEPAGTRKRQPANLFDAETSPDLVKKVLVLSQGAPQNKAIG